MTYQEYLREKDKPSSSTSVVQSSINKFLPSTSTTDSQDSAAWSKSYDSKHPKQHMLTESIIHNVIVMCGLPVSLIDHPNFRQFLRDIDPKYTPPCRQTITNSFLPKLVSSSKSKLQSVLDSADYVSLTADIWTDRRAHSFLGVTVHMFGHGSRKPNSNLLAFRHFEGSHTGQRIADELDGILEEFGIASKTRFIVTDNASNMKKALCVLFGTVNGCDEPPSSTDKYFDDHTLWEDHDEDAVTVPDTCRRLPCFAHSLQLVIRDGLQNLTSCRSALGKVSKLANIIHQSALFRGSFEGTFGAGRAIPETNATRWNSAYKQLRCVVDLDQQKLADVLRDTSHENLVLSKKELDQLNELVDLLGPFAEATDLCQGDQTVTISCVVPVVLALNRLLDDKQQSPSTRFFGDLISKLQKGMSIFWFSYNSSLSK